MLIYGVSGIFAHKKTIKQFLQPMTEQVWGEGEDVPRGCAAIFGSIFQSYCIFVSVFFFNSPMPFWGRFCQYLHIFLRTASIFLGSIFDTGCFIFCSTVLSLSGTLPPFFYGELPSLSVSMHYKKSKMVM